MKFAALALAACFGCFDGLGVQDADGRLRIAIQRLSRQFPQRIIDFDKSSEITDKLLVNCPDYDVRIVVTDFDPTLK